MNENLNLVEILKDVPTGTKLYSPIFGEVKFFRIERSDYPIKAEPIKPGINPSYCSFTSDGRYYTYYDGECMLFPSKDQRDWSKFKVEPKKVEVVLHPFDRVLGKSSNGLWNIDFYSYYDEDDEYPYICMSDFYKVIIPFNDETAHLLGRTDPCPIDYEIK